MAEGQVLMEIEISNSAISARTYHFNVEVGEKSYELAVVLDRPIVDESGFLGDYDAQVESIVRGVSSSLTPKEHAFFSEICLNIIYEFETPDSFDTVGHFERPCTANELEIFQ